MATQSNVLALRIPGKGEPGGLPSMGSHRVGHDWSDLAAAAGVQWGIQLSLSLSLYIYICINIAFIYIYMYEKLKDAQSCLTICNRIVCSLPGSSVHGIPQARTLEWVAIPLFRVSFWPRDQTWVSCIAGGFFTIWATREANIYILFGFFFKFFSIIGYYKILNTVPSAIQ